jgi:hypothetical protein
MTGSQLNLFPDNNPPNPTHSILPGVDPQKEAKRQEKLYNRAYAYLKDWIVRKHGTANELVNDLTAAFGPIIRMYIIELLSKIRENSTLINIDVEYIDSNLNLEAIEFAIQGKKKKKRIDDKTLDELFFRISEARHSKKFIEILNFVSKLSEYAPYNNMMVYLQRPTAKYWAREKDWNERFKRTIKEDAIPLIILRPMGPIMLVYEIEDTEGPELPEDLLHPFKVKGKFDPDDLEYLVHECLKNGIKVKGATLRGFLAGRATRAGNKELAILIIELNKNHKNREQFATLCHEIAHIYLGHLGGDPKGRWPSRIGLSRSQRELEAEAVAYIVCRRRNLITLSADYLAGYWAKPVDRENVSVDMIMKVAGRIEQKLPKIISHTKTSFEDKAHELTPI